MMMGSISGNIVYTLFFSYGKLLILEQVGPLLFSPSEGPEFRKGTLFWLSNKVLISSDFNRPYHASGVLFHRSRSCLYDRCISVLS